MSKHKQILQVSSATLTQHEQTAYHRLWWIGSLAIIASLAANVIIRILVDVIFTIPLTFTPLTWERFSLFTVIGVVGAVGVFAIVGRFARHPLRTFQWIATIVFLLSFIPNLVLLIENPIPGTTIPGIVTLMVMHLPPALFSVGLLTKLGYKSHNTLPDHY